MNRSSLLTKGALALGLALAVVAGGVRTTAGQEQAQSQPARPAMGIVVNEDNSTLSLLDPAQERITGMVRIVNAAAFSADVVKGALNKPHLADYDRATGMLYVGNKGSTITAIDMSNWNAPRMVASVKPGGNGEIHRVRVAGGLVWLAHEGDSTVYAYDPRDFSAPRYRLGKGQGFDTTHGLTLRPGTNELWATNRPTNAPGTITRIDVTTGKVIGSPLQTTGKAGDRPNNIEFTEDGKWAYAVNTGSKATEVTVIDAEKFVVVKQIVQDATVGRAPHAIVFEPVTRRMFIVNKDSPTLSVISTRTNEVLGYFTIGAEPHGVQLGPDGMVYATAKKGNRIAVIDPKSLQVVRTITDPSLNGPHYILFTEGYRAPAEPAAPRAPGPNSPRPVVAIRPAPVAAAEPAIAIMPAVEPAAPAAAPTAATSRTASGETRLPGGVLALLTLGVLAVCTGLLLVWPRASRW